ncbi:MAG: aspartate 1-decarboxylase [Desulfonatronovibrionaceae bacterium]
MYRYFLLSKIHRATITGADPEYEGSLSICPDLMRAAGILPYERVEVYNVDNGERLSTYAISGARGEMCLNGAAAHRGKVGQKVIVAVYGLLSGQEIPVHKPRLVFVGQSNRMVKVSCG